MRITLSNPKVIAGKKINDRISKDYIEIATLLPENDYRQIQNTNFHMIAQDYKYIINEVFNPKNNKSRYLVKGSDANSDSYEPFLQDEYTYEPLMIKCWLPNSKILKHCLESITDSAYFDFIEVRKHTLPRKDENLRTLYNWIINYNSTIQEEKERREEWKEKLNNETKFLDKAKNFIPRKHYNNYLLE